MAFFLSTPTGDLGNVRSSEIIRIFTAEARRSTSFFLQVGETQTVLECRGRLTCLVLRARTDYGREDLAAPGGGFLPYSEHVRRMNEKRRSYPRYLLVVSNLTQGGSADRLTAVFVDTDAALELHHSAPRDRADWERELDAQITERAVLVGPARAELRSAQDGERFVAHLFEDLLRPLLERSGHWEPFGSVELSLAQPGAQISLDGTAVGVTRPGKTTLLEVLPGRRKLSLEHLEYQPVTREVEVKPGEVARVELSLERAATPLVRTVRSGLLIGGGALAAAGAVVVGLAVARADSGVETACFTVNRCAEGPRFVTSAYDSSAAVDVNPPGVMLAPLGYSLAAAGTTFALTSLLGDESSFPWWELILGTAVGVTSYALSSLLEGARP